MTDRPGHDKLRQNVRLALITLSIAFALFVGYVLRRTLL